MLSGLLTAVLHIFVVANIVIFPFYFLRKWQIIPGNKSIPYYPYIAGRTVGELQSNPMRRWSKEYGYECCVCVSFHLTGHFRPGNGKRKRGDEVTHVHIKKGKNTDISLVSLSFPCAIENSPLDR